MVVLTLKVEKYYLPEEWTLKKKEILDMMIIKHYKLTGIFSNEEITEFVNDYALSDYIRTKFNEYDWQCDFVSVKQHISLTSKIIKIDVRASKSDLEQILVVLEAKGIFFTLRKEND